MIVPMKKFSFMIFYMDYENFLKKIQELGVLHVEMKNIVDSEDTTSKSLLINQLDKTISSLIKRNAEQTVKQDRNDGIELLREIMGKQNDLERINQKLTAAKKELSQAEPWGIFSPAQIEKLKEHGIIIQFFTAVKKRFNFEEYSKKTDIEVISERGNYVHFIAFGKEAVSFDINEADEITGINHSADEMQNRIYALEKEISDINVYLDEIASGYLPLLEKTKTRLAEDYDYKRILDSSETIAEDKIMILTGWAPRSSDSELRNYLDHNDFVYLVENPEPKENVPVLLKNNSFSRLFEPIGKLFSLPAYQELDLTMYFAPFYMMFFGFCLGDAGYGLLFIVAGGILKMKIKKDFKPYLTLLQWLGGATVLFGILTGTFFGINLIEAEFNFLAEFKKYFLDPNKVFNLALILGVVQIIFGMIIKSINRGRQYGFQYSLSTIGWIIVLLGSVLYFLLSKAGIIPASQNILYAILATGGFFILFFSDPKSNILVRFGKGLWDIYNSVTGIFGDVLSYIRLFALGLSSAILGYVINDIGMQILGTGPVIGHLLFVVFMLFGHGLNILIATLGAFVHPMRLTFVEFYKNAGFEGGGKEYKPFSKNIETN